MIRSTVKITDNFGRVEEELRRRAVHALNDAAAEAAREADRQANHPTKIADFAVVPARGTENGFSAGIRGGPLTNIFDKGSLGQHKGAPKRPRKPAWQVTRGANPYVAHRHPIAAGSGVAARGILAAARKAGRAVLIRRLRG